MDALSLHDLLYKFIDEYDKELKEARKTENYKRPFGAIVRKEIAGAVRSVVADDIYYVKGSVGAGPMGVVGGLMGAWLMKVAVGTDKKRKKDEE